jgi:PAS domain S-box-containing protein
MEDSMGQSSNTAHMLSLDYKQLFAALPQPYIVFATDDPDFTVLAQSDAHAKMTLVKPGQVIGKTAGQAYPSNSGYSQKNLELTRRAIRTGKPGTLPMLRYDIRQPDGTFVERYWQVSIYPLLGDDGKVIAVLQQAEDITDARQASQRATDAQQQLEEALRIANVGIWRWDIQTNKIYIDKNLARLFGYSEDETAAGLPQSAFHRISHPEDRERVNAEIARTIKYKRPFESEFRIVPHSDGTSKWILGRGHIESDGHGKAKLFLGIAIDITERKYEENRRQFLVSASAALTESLDYKKTLRKIAKLVVPTIADWCAVDILDANHGLQLVAVAHKDPEKVRWGRELRKEQPVNLSAPTGLPQVLRTGKPEFYPQITKEFIQASVKTKKEYDLAIRLALSGLIIVPLRVQDRVVGAITLITTDGRYYTKADLDMATDLANRASLAMTNAYLYETTQSELQERRRLEAELYHANEELETRVQLRTQQLQDLNANLNRSNQELQDFAYVASHDLQEPLRKIQAFGNLLEQEYGAVLGEGLDYLRRMRSASARMSTLIGDLLSFSRVTTQAKPFKPINLNSILADVLSDLETRIAETHGTVATDALPTIEADPVQIRQLLQNLISNALKFHKPDMPPAVRISASPKTDKTSKIKYCQLMVSDNGIGFDEKYLDRIFAVFQRLHSHDSYEGTGIGLAVCRKIAERHGGTITATSKRGEGSTFIVSLPYKHRKGGSNL